MLVLLRQIIMETNNDFRRIQEQRKIKLYTIG